MLMKSIDSFDIESQSSTKCCNKDCSNRKCCNSKCCNDGCGRCILIVCGLVSLFVIFFVLFILSKY
jgi:hypothetical protein